MKEKNHPSPPLDLLRQIEDKAAQPAQVPAQEVRPLRSAGRVVRTPYSTKLDPELLKRMKIYAVEADMRENEVIEAALRYYLDSGKR